MHCRCALVIGVHRIAHRTRHHVQALHSCAYSGALGRPLVCPADHVALLNADTLKQFTAANYTAPRVVVAGAGMPHDALVNLATPLFEGMAGGAANEPVSKYVGGDWRCVWSPL